MTPFWDTYEGMEARPPTKRVKTDETKIAWFATQIAPALKTLKEHGKLREACLALFSQCWDDAELERRLELLWEDVDS